MGKSCLGIPAALFLLADFSIVDSMDSMRILTKPGNKKNHKQSKHKETTFIESSSEQNLLANDHSVEGFLMHEYCGPLPSSSKTTGWWKPNRWSLRNSIVIIFVSLVALATIIALSISKPWIPRQSVGGKAPNVSGASKTLLSWKEWNGKMGDFCKDQPATFTSPEPGTVTTVASGGETLLDRLKGGLRRGYQQIFHPDRMKSLISDMEGGLAISKADAEKKLLAKLLEKWAEGGGNLSKEEIGREYGKFVARIDNMVGDRIDDLKTNICSSAPGTERERLVSLVSAAIMAKKTLEESKENWLYHGYQALEKCLGSERGTKKWDEGRLFIAKEIKRILSVQYPKERVLHSTDLEEALQDLEWDKKTNKTTSKKKTNKTTSEKKDN